MLQIVPLFKALADESRIRIISTISEQARSVEEIATLVDLAPATVSHHLARLREAGLVEATPRGYYTYYRFTQQPLVDALRTLSERPPAAEAEAGLDAYDQKVLRDYLVDGRFKAIPAQRKKRAVILRFLAEQFEPGRIYSEKEVSDILATYHEDFATLRRELVMARLLARPEGRYQRVPAPAGDHAAVP